MEKRPRITLVWLSNGRLGTIMRGAIGMAIAGFLLLAALGTVLMDSRKQSNPDWARFAAQTSNVPFLAIAQGRNRIVWREIGWLRPAIGLVAFGAVLSFHP